MIKETIILRDESKYPLSLRALPLMPDCDDRIEYIFYTLNIARDFDDLTDLLERVLDCSFTEQQRFDNSIQYEVIISGKPCSLIFKTKEKAILEAA